MKTIKSNYIKVINNRIYDHMGLKYSVTPEWRGIISDNKLLIPFWDVYHTTPLQDYFNECKVPYKVISKLFATNDIYNCWAGYIEIDSKHIMIT